MYYFIQTNSFHTLSIKNDPKTQRATEEEDVEVVVDMVVEVVEDMVVEVVEDSAEAVELMVVAAEDKD